MTEENTKQINIIRDRLALIDRLIQWISRREDLAAWVGGYGAHGELDPMRERLLIQSNRLLDRLQVLGGTPAFQYR